VSILLGILEPPMANLRSIKIVQAGNLAAFQPDSAGVQAGDRIHWNNETNNDHQLQMSDGFMTDNIPGGAVSNPGYIAKKPVSYQCLVHPQEQGTIQIVPAVVMAPAMVPAAAVPAVASLASGAAAPSAAPAPKKGAKKKVKKKEV
jgi:plastocyanin